MVLNMKKYIFPLLCTLLPALPLHAQKSGATQPEATAEYYINHYQFTEAEELINQNIKKLKRRRQATDAEESKLEEISRLRSMMRATERVTIIDSLVVDKNTFLSHIKLSPESGEINQYGAFFNRTDTNGCTVYLSELGNKIYFAQPDENKYLRLFTSDLVGGQWTSPHKLDELDGDDAQNYPFMLSDGITLYYAARGEESIGGYDIFVTRYDMDEKKFLYPENLGMPYNSPANDYMLAIDEFNNLGWFVSDRNQPEGKVCIYIFIPNEIRKLYDANLYEEYELCQLALIHSIAATWGDKEAVAQARQRLQNTLNAPKTAKKKKDFEFVIDDRNTYTVLKDFKSPEARKKMAAWQKSSQQLAKNRQQLQTLRERYSTSNDAQRQALSQQILSLEAQCENEETALHAEAKNIRNLEIQTCNK